MQKHHPIRSRGEGISDSAYWHITGEYFHPNGNRSKVYTGPPLLALSRKAPLAQSGKRKDQNALDKSACVAWY